MSFHGPGIPAGGRLCSSSSYAYVGRGGTPTTYIPLNGSVTTAPANSTYTIGGAQPPQTTTGDSKLPYKDPADAEKVAYAIITQGGNRIASGELWNEVAWPLGSRPFTDVPLLCRIFAHQYVGIKKALKDAGRPFNAVTAMFAGTAMVNDDTFKHIGVGENHFFNAMDWYDKCLTWFMDTDPTYFTNLMADRGLTGNYAKTRAPKFPGDVLAMHPYGQYVLDPKNMGMNQCAKVYNMVGARAGAYLPFCAVEQGLGWDSDGGFDWHNNPIYDRHQAFTLYTAWIDILHGNRPWPYNTRLNGPGTGTHLPTGSGPGQITLAERRRKMRMVSDRVQWFAIRIPKDAHAEMGIGWDKDNNKKYTLGQEDAMHAMRTVDISGL